MQYVLLVEILTSAQELEDVTGEFQAVEENKLECSIEKNANANMKRSTRKWMIVAENGITKRSA